MLSVNKWLAFQQVGLQSMAVVLASRPMGSNVSHLLSNNSNNLQKHTCMRKNNCAWELLD